MDNLRVMDNLYINGQKIEPFEDAECELEKQWDSGYRQAELKINDLTIDILIKKSDIKKIKEINKKSSR